MRPDSRAGYPAIYIAASSNIDSPLARAASSESTSSAVGRDPREAVSSSFSPLLPLPLPLPSRLAGPSSGWKRPGAYHCLFAMRDGVKSTHTHTHTHISRHIGTQQTQVHDTLSVATEEAEKRRCVPTRMTTGSLASSHNY